MDRSSLSFSRLLPQKSLPVRISMTFRNFSTALREAGNDRLRPCSGGSSTLRGFSSAFHLAGRGYCVSDFRLSASLLAPFWRSAICHFGWCTDRDAVVASPDFHLL